MTACLVNTGWKPCCVLSLHALSPCSLRPDEPDFILGAPNTLVCHAPSGLI